ncbi:MAG: gluconokinase [Abitibacteriaceae bacterium]|nr:gluconokinase [Abditibacteriaceae bacterium]
MESQPLVLALDIGTSSTRALAFDAQGHKVGQAVQYAYHQTTTPDGGIETDADALLELTARCIDELLPHLNQPVIAVGTCSFWHSLMAVSADGQPATKVLSWADNRAAAWVPALRALLNEHDTHARTGCVFHPSYWPAKLLWLHQSQPELFQDNIRWMSFAEYAALRLFGEAHCSLSMASGTGIFHQVNCEWDDDTLAALPIKRDQLSPLCDAHDALPHLQPEWAKRWPALKDAKWFPALGDGACSNIGSGCVTPSHIAMNVGTSGALRVVLENYQDPAPHGLWRYRIDRKRSVMGGALSNAGNVWKWAHDTLNLPPDFEAQLADLEPMSHGLTVLPFLAGERSPLWDANARYVLAGASLDTSPVEILRASLEAVALRFAEVAFAVRKAIPEAPPDVDIVFSGGALEGSSVWAQIMSDCIGTPLVESREKEASARGAALMALEACGVIEDIGAVPSDRGQELQPTPAHHELYKRALERQNALYEHLYGATH